MVVIFAFALKAKPEPVMGLLPETLFDLSQVNDGTYRGSYGIAENRYAVDITIEAHSIKEITIITGPKQVFTRKCGLCEALAMIKEVKTSQSLPVDAYSGATQSTTAILRAIEAALIPQGEAQDDASPFPEAWR